MSDQSATDAADQPTRVREAPTPEATPTLAAPELETPPPATSIPPGPGAASSVAEERPELLVLGAFAGGLVLATILKRLGR
jgi:hypothetical protein